MVKPDDFQRIIIVDDAARAHKSIHKSRLRPRLQQNKLPESPSSFSREEEDMVMSKLM